METAFAIDAGSFVESLRQRGARATRRRGEMSESKFRRHTFYARISCERGRAVRAERARRIAMHIYSF